MIRRESLFGSTDRIKPAISLASDDDDWSRESDTEPDAESDGDECGDFDDWPPDELDLQIDDEPDPEPGDFWLDDDDNEDD